MRKKSQRISFIALVAVLFFGAVFDLNYAPNASAVINASNTLVTYNSTNTGPLSGGADYSTISADGNFVAYLSNSTDAVSGDTNGHQDLFLRNLSTNTTVLVDQSTAGVQASIGVYASGPFAVSRTGRYVLFTSYDQHLISGLTTDGAGHVYLRDTVLNTTTLVDQTATGTIGNGDGLAVSISDDGRFANFTSRAKNLGGGADGYARVYMKDLSNNTLQALSRSVGGSNANNAASGGYASCDGSLVALGSGATNLTPTNNGHGATYLVDLRNGFSITNLTLAANDTTSPVSISCNGRYVLILSRATNLTADSVSGTIPHLFRYDRLSGEFVLIDQSSSGVAATNGGSVTNIVNGQYISDQGAAIFASYDEDLVSPSASSRYELYLRNPEINTTELVATDSLGNEQNHNITAWGHNGSISADGKSILFASGGTNLIPGMTTGGIFVSKQQ